METAEYALMDEAEQRMWWYRALHARLLDALSGVAGRLLDAGCGTGGLLALLNQRRPDLVLTGVEWSPLAATRARDKSGADLVQGSVNTLPFADAAFHAAVDPAAALAELRRVLRPGGLLLVNMPAFAWLSSAHDRRVHNARRVSATELQSWLAAAGFTGIRVRYWNSLLLPLMIAQRKIRARRHGDVSDVVTFPPWLDAILHGATALEHRLPFALPAGGSVLAIARVPD
ncbi:MAG TPA: class I SAM-dependent methyltransferase [Acetobacteraceae bacterium]